MLENLANATERTIRYLIPGIWIFVLYVLSRSEPIQCTLDGKVDLLVFTAGIGFITYIYFRQFLEFLEHYIFNKKDIELLSKKFLLLYPEINDIREYLNFKFANVHVSELLPITGILSALIFGVQAAELHCFKNCFLWINAIVLALGVLNHYVLYKITSRIYDKLEIRDRNPSK